MGNEVFTESNNLTSVTFIGKTLDQVQNIEDESGQLYYPWGISDTSIIHVAWFDIAFKNIFLNYHLRCK